jgi:hypothetical protein
LGIDEISPPRRCMGFGIESNGAVRGRACISEVGAGLCGMWKGIAAAATVSFMGDHSLRFDNRLVI